MKFIVAGRGTHRRSLLLPIGKLGGNFPALVPGDQAIQTPILHRAINAGFHLAGAWTGLTGKGTRWLQHVSGAAHANGSYRG